MLHPKESWIAENWRPAAAIIYLVICLFDFIVAPTFMFLTRETTDHLVGVLSHSRLDVAVQTILVQPHAAWVPLTLQGAGMFHIAFGGILGVSAWSRGTEKRELIRSRLEMAVNAVGDKVTAIVPAAAPIVNNVKVKIENMADTALDATATDSVDNPDDTAPDNPDA
jgi:hypothetical protein